MANEEAQDQKDEQQQNGNSENQGSQKRSQDPRKKRKTRFIILAVVVIAIIAAIPVYAYYSVRESTDDAQVDGHIIPVSTRINGNIISVLVDDNQPVRAGQELVRLDPADYQVALDQAKAQLAGSEASSNESVVNVPLTRINTSSQVKTSNAGVLQSQAALAASEQGARGAEARLGGSKFTLAQRQANYLKAQKDLIRQKELVDKDEISKQDYDTAVASADAQAAQVESAKSDIVAAQHEVDQSLASVKQSEASLAQALVSERQSRDVAPKQQAVQVARYKQALAQIDQGKANVSQAMLNMNYTIVKSPVDGVITQKSAEPGQRISPGQQLMMVIPLDDVWITANFKETQLKHMRVGQHVEVAVDTYGGRKFAGHIDSISGTSGARTSLLPPENATGNYVKVVQRIPVKIRLEPGANQEHILRPGMSVMPTVLLNSTPEG